MGRGRAEEGGHGFAGGLDNGVGALAGEERAVGVGVGAHEVVSDGVDGAPGHLSAGRVVEVEDGGAVLFDGEGGELGADPVGVDER